MTNHTFYVFVASEISRRRLVPDADCQKNVQIIEIYTSNDFIAFDSAAGAFFLMNIVQKRNKNVRIISNCSTSLKVIEFRLKKTHDLAKSIQNKELSDLRPKKTVNE